MTNGTRKIGTEPVKAEIAARGGIIAVGDRELLKAASGKVIIRDTEEFNKRVDVKGILEAAPQEKELVIVSQFPKAGEQLAAGTPVNIIVMYKDSIRIDDVKELSEEVAAKYKEKSVGTVTRDIDGSKEAKAVFSEGKKYAELTSTQKTDAKNYMIAKGILPEEATVEKQEKVYEDLRFFYNF